MSRHLRACLLKTLLCPGTRFLTLSTPKQHTHTHLFNPCDCLFWCIYVSNGPLNMVTPLLCRFYASLLNCLHLVLVDPKSSLLDHVRMCFRCKIKLLVFIFFHCHILFEFV